MQNASVEFEDAVESTAFETAHRVTLIPLAASPVAAAVVGYTDWTEAVESLEIDESVVTDAPDGTRLISGYPARTATVILAYDKPFNDAVTIGWLLDAYNTQSPLFRYDVLGWGIKIEFGVYVNSSEMPEFITKFTGVIDDVDTDTQSGTVTIVCLDNRGKLSSAPGFPENAGPSSTVEANGLARWTAGNGLTSLWPMDYLLYRSGYYSSPPPYSQAWIVCSMHGSGNPEQRPYSWWKGTAEYGGLSLGIESPSASDMIQGKWSPQLAPSAVWSLDNDGAIVPRTDAAMTVGNGFEIGWYEQVTTTPGAYSAVELIGATSSDFICQVGVVQFTSGGAQAVAFVSGIGGSTTTNLLGPLLTDFGTWHQFWFRVSITSTTVAKFEVWIDGTHYSVNISDGTYGGGAVPGRVKDVRWDSYLPLEAMQMIKPGPVAGLPGPPDHSAFVPTVYLDPSLQDLIIPADEQGNDAWGAIQRIASAEGMYAGFDETGVFRSKNRRTLAAQAPVRAVTSDTSLKQLSHRSNRANFRNRIRIPGDAFAQLGPTQVVWTLDAPFYLASGQTYTRIISLDTPAVALGLGATVTVPALGVDYLLHYTTAQNNDGTGTSDYYAVNLPKLKVTASYIDANTFKVVAINKSGKNVWFTVPTAAATATYTAGSAGMWQVGCLAVPLKGLGDTYVESLDQQSIDQYGEQFLLLDANPWFQDETACAEYADDLLADLYNPRPVLQNVSWVPDPRLQLTDRITLLDPDVTGMAEDGLIIGMHWSMSNGTWECTSDLRTYSGPGGWLMGVDTRSEMGETTYV